MQSMALKPAQPLQSGSTCTSMQMMGWKEKQGCHSNSHAGAASGYCFKGAKCGWSTGRME